MDICITNLIYNPDGYDLPEEHVEITSFEDTDINMKNWLIQDAVGHTYRFPEYILKPGETVYIWTGDGVNEDKNLYWGRRSPVWNNTGDTATLRNPDGVEIHKYEYSPKNSPNEFRLSAVWDDFRDVNKSNVWISDFDGDDAQNILFYSHNSSNWHLGTFCDSVLNWDLSNNSSGFGNLLRSSIRMFAGDFLGKGKSQILFYCANDGNIWLGAFDNNNKIKWSLVNNCKDFGNLTDKSIRIFTGDFTGSGKTELLFYYSGDGNWWHGSFIDNTFQWSTEPVNNSSGFGKLTDSRIRIFTGDFTGSKRTELLFYNSDDGNWWHGTFINRRLVWSTGPVNNSISFGNLNTITNYMLIGDFTGSKKTELLFHNTSDGNWLHGSFRGSKLYWTDKPVNNRKFNVGMIGLSLRIFTGDFTGLGKTQLLIYSAIDDNWWLGSFHDDKLIWTDNPVDNSAGFGSLIRSGITMWTGDFEGCDQTQILFYFAGDGHWWIGKVHENKLWWRCPSDTNSNSVFPVKCHIRTKTQQYLQDKGITLKSEGMNPGKRETFIVEEVKGTASGLLNGTKVRIKTSQGNYLKTIEEENGVIFTNGKISDNTIFTIVIPAGEEVFRIFNKTGKKFALMASNGKYCSVKHGQVYADQDDINKCEVFHVEKLLSDEYNVSVEGRIVNKQNVPVSGLEVKAYDEDVFFNDALGSCRTDEDGYFYIAYSRSDYGPPESNPDLFIEAYDGDVLVFSGDLKNDVGDIYYDFGTLVLPGNVNVPDVVNTHYSKACEIIKNAKLKPIAHILISSLTDELYVSGQNPSAGTSVPIGSDVYISLVTKVEPAKLHKALRFFNEAVDKKKMIIMKKEELKNWTEAGKIEYRASPFVLNIPDNKIVHIAAAAEGTPFNEYDVSTHRLYYIVAGGKDGIVEDIVLI